MHGEDQVFSAEGHNTVYFMLDFSRNETVSSRYRGRKIFVSYDGYSIKAEGEVLSGQDRDFALKSYFANKQGKAD